MSTIIAEPKVRVLPQEQTLPARRRMPLAHARRWWSPHEEDSLKAVVTVFVTQKAYVRFCAHAGSDLDREVGGGLVGRWCVDPTREEQFVVVESVLQARHTRQGSTFLTFTQDTLVAMNEEMEKHYPGKKLVGWYHTHPRMGVFLSGYDLFLHQNFFPEPWQVALVMEPHTRQGGFFIRQSDEILHPQKYFGMYELQVAGRDVVHWTNLQPEEKQEPVLAAEEGGNQ